MVEVDVFWAYGIGASFATAARYKIRPAPQAADEHADPLEPVALEDSFWRSPYVMATALYCGLLFAPSGAWLLWGFPDWETMQVATGYSSLPPWLVALFAATNVSQGVLGFWVASRLIRSGRTYLAFVQAALGYFGMFFILVHGWDGRGYQRFFSADRSEFLAWPTHPGFFDALSRAVDWMTSPVAFTLYGMGLVLFPVMGVLMLKWLRDGHREAGVESPPSPIVLIAAVVVGLLGVALGAAIVDSILIHLLGWWVGGVAAILFTVLVVLRPRTGLAHPIYALLKLDNAPSTPVASRTAQRSTATV